ncbi:MAG: transposase, partial [Candidatus Methanomethylophilus sp.]|nr:transposase [Methanomethylophilus sp.]
LFRDASAGTFMRLLRYKGEETGSEIVPVNPAYTSRICTKCGKLNDPFSEETFHCRFCGFTIHRDDNACENVLRRGMGFDILGTSPIA